ncbi:MAG: PHP domain-containing protein [Erysipelotrichaceae bacterium]|nr:PHP domain-containing protein [Erysipelotrichaceae bacterium]
MIDGHMHLEYGPLNKEYVLEFVEAARKKGLSEIQILDHTHRFIEFEEMYEPLKKYEVQKVWLENRKMKFKDHLKDYIELMKKIQEMDLGIRVKYGLEICYTPESEEFIRNVVKDYEFDFLVGAIHSIDGILYDMSFSKELLWDVYDANHIYERYYDLLMKVVDSNIFTQLAHPDTIKMFDIYPDYDLNDTYHLLSKKLKEKKMKAECNTGCHYRYDHKDIGLSDELLKIFIEEDIEIITASDAHKPEDVGSYIKEANERIIKMKEKTNV